MEFTYDTVADALYISISKERVNDSDEACPGIVVDYNEHGDVIGVEVIGFSRRRDLDLNDLIKLDADHLVPTLVKCQLTMVDGG